MTSRYEKLVKKISKRAVLSKTRNKKSSFNKQDIRQSSSRRPYPNTRRNDRLKKNAGKKRVQAHPAKAHILRQKRLEEHRQTLEEEQEAKARKAAEKHPYRTGYYDEDRIRVRTFKRRVKRTPGSKLPDDANKKLNTVFYKNIDPVYSSFWLGRFINTFQKNGKKRYASREVYLGLSLFKYAKNTNPLIYFFEVLDKIKPTLKLRNYLAKRGKIKKYPVPVLPATKIMVATHWLKQEVKNTQDDLRNGRISASLSAVLTNFKENERKNTLAEKRKQYMRECIMGQFNARFMYRSR